MQDGATTKGCCCWCMTTCATVAYATTSTAVATCRCSDGSGAALRYRRQCRLGPPLHSQRVRRVVVHRDLTSSNVMLDAVFNARLGDFGLARAVNSGETSFTDVDAVGTWGYIDYECCTNANFTCESDVYAFGVLVLEVVCGRPRLHKGNSGFHVLVDWLSNLHGEGRLVDAVDQRLGLASSHPNRSLRPTA